MIKIFDNLQTVSQIAKHIIGNQLLYLTQLISSIPYSAS